MDLSFHLCDCGQHGHFSSELGRGPFVASRDEAMAVVEAALSRGTVGLERASRLYAAIERAGLPANDALVDPAVRADVRTFEMAHAATNGDLDPGLFHAIIRRA